MFTHSRRLVGWSAGVLACLAGSFAACSDGEDAPSTPPVTLVDGCAPGDLDAGDGGETSTAEAGTVSGGKLFIIGGAVTDTSPIWDRVIEEGGGKANIHFLVVTAATSRLVSNFSYYRDILFRIHGVSFDNIRQLQISDQDDESSKFVDEREWKDNADKDEMVAEVRDWATVVWFAGGDQAHIMSTFTNPDGSDRKVTKAIRDKLNAGKLIVAGTSAGAAIMSDPMIGEGDPYNSWLYSPLYTKYYPENTRTDAGPDGGQVVFNKENAVLLNKGLGFVNAISPVLIDTHWFQRARFARTLRAIDYVSSAASAQPEFPNGLNPKMKVGLGIGENSGILIDITKQTGEIVGDPDMSWVGVVNINGATTSGMTNPYAAENVRVSYVGVRDRLGLPTDANPNGQFFPEASKTRYLPCNGARDLAPFTGDMFISGGYIDALQNLLDGEKDDAGTPCHVEAFGSRLSPGSNSYNGQPFQFRGFFFRFTSDARTKEFWSESWGWEVENALMRFGTGNGSYTPPF